jgi:large subunit ribosomal protein L13e
LVVFPRRENKPKKGEINDATAEQLKNAANWRTTTLPIARAVNAVEYAKITDADRDRKVFRTLRTVRTNTRYKGRREKKAADKEKAEK